MNKIYAFLFLFSLFLVFFALLRVGDYTQISYAQSYYVPVQLDLNESKNINILLWNGLVLQNWITINQSGLANFAPGMTVVLTSQYPFTVNGEPATYTNSSNPIYFYKFVATKPETLNIDFLPEPLPNTPVGYIIFGSPPPCVAYTNTAHINTQTNTQPETTSVIKINAVSKSSILVLLSRFLIVLSIIYIAIISILLVIKKK